MRYRTLGRSGAVVSSFALGTMTFGETTDAAVAARIVDRFVGAGGTLLETADVYAGGMAETILGGILRSLEPGDRERVFLATKGRFPVGVDPRDSGTSRRHLRRALEASLRRLGVEHVDLYQVHSWDPVTPLDETLGFLEDAVHAGLISYAGISNFTGWQTAKAAAMAAGRFPLVSSQPQYNLLVREVEWEIIPAAIDGGMGVLPWSPLAGGWLTGKYQRDTTPTGSTRLGEDPDRGVEAYGRRNGLDRTWEVLRALGATAARIGATEAQVALAWLVARPGVASVIVGARTPEQLEQNVGAAAIELGDDDVALLDRASDPQAADWPYGASGIEQRSRPIG